MICHCFIRHATTPDERAAAVKRLEEARILGDTNGMIIALASLSSKCPARNREKERRSETLYRSHL